MKAILSTKQVRATLPHVDSGFLKQRFLSLPEDEEPGLRDYEAGFGGAEQGLPTS